MAYGVQSAWRAFSSGAQTDIATAATVDMRVPFEGEVSAVEWDRRHNDKNRMTGTPLATASKGITKKHEFSHKIECTPNIIGLFGSMVLGNATVSSLTGSARRHRMMPSLANKELPYRTMVENDGFETLQYKGVACKKLKIMGKRGDIVTAEAEFVSSAVEAASVLTAPAQVSESWLDFSNITFSRGGTWNGTAISGATELKAPLVSFEVEVDNNATPNYTMGRGDTGRGPGEIVRGKDGVSVKAKFTLQLDGASHHTALMAGTEYVFAIPMWGDVISGSDKYGVHIVLPRAIYANGKKTTLEDGSLGLDCELEVLHEDTYKGLVLDVVNTQTAAYL